MTTSRSTGSRKPRRPWRNARRPAGVPTLGYASVPPREPLDGPEAQAQRLQIESACPDLGLELVDLVRDQEPEEPGNEGRPGLSYAFERLEAGEASCLIVSDLPRLSRAVEDLAQAIDRLERARVRLIALDVGLDTATATGRLAVTPRGGREVAEPQAPRAAESKATADPPDPKPPGDEVPASAAPALRALGYVSVPEDGGKRQLAAQERAIRRAAERLDLDLIEVVKDREAQAGKALDRPGVSYLIERLATGEAACVVVSGLERLSRSVSELGTIVQWLDGNAIRLVAVELDLDTASAGGRSTARAIASVAGVERERLGDRTRKGLAAARAKRRTTRGSATFDWDALKERIAAMRADGMTLQGIADVLNAEGVPTQRGGAEWRVSSVQTAVGYKRPPRPSKAEELPKVRRPGAGGGRSSS